MEQHVNIGIIGEYDPDLRYHIATNEALDHAAAQLSVSLRSTWISTRALDAGSVGGALQSFDGIWCAPGDHEHIAGTILGIRFAREHDKPFIGT